MGIIIIQVTYPNINEANESISNLLNKNLISSANTFPIKSISKWTGEIKEVDEISVLLKTREENWEKVKNEVEETHSYEIPCIIKIKAESNNTYEDWVKKQTEQL